MGGVILDNAALFDRRWFGRYASIRAVSNAIGILFCNSIVSKAGKAVSFAGMSLSTESAMDMAANGVTSKAQRELWLTAFNAVIALPLADVEAIREILEGQRIIRRKSDIIAEGYRFRKLAFIESGIAAQYKLLRNGKRQIFNLLLPGDIFGFPICFYERAIYSVVAMTDLKVRFCPFESFMQLSYKRPAVAVALLAIAAEVSAIYAERITDTGRRSPIERVTHFLLEFHSRLKKMQNADDDNFDFPLSQEVIGDLLGLSAPHVNRILRKLRTDGLIEISGSTIFLNDIESLEIMAQFQRPPLAQISAPQ